MRNRLTRAIGVAAFLVFLAVLPIIGEAQTSETKHQQAVLVTGASAVSVGCLFLGRKWMSQARASCLLPFKDEDVGRTSAGDVDGHRQGLAIGRKPDFL